MSYPRLKGYNVCALISKYDYYVQLLFKQARRRGVTPGVVWPSVPAVERKGYGHNADSCLCCWYPTRDVGMPPIIQRVNATHGRYPVASWTSDLGDRNILWLCKRCACLFHKPFRFFVNPTFNATLIICLILGFPTFHSIFPHVTLAIYGPDIST